MARIASLAAFMYVAMVSHATINQITTKFRFPCGPQDCADAVCWNDRRDWPTLNHPILEPFYPNAKQAERNLEVCRHSPFVGMTVLVLRRVDFPSINFDRSWQDYENGFGTRGNHWLGLKHMHKLSSRTIQMVSLEIQDQTGAWRYRTWNRFSVDSAFNHYALYLGTPKELPDLMESARGQSFYSRDRNNTTGKQTCGLRFNSGWWFGKCNGSMLELINLNGRFNTTSDTKIFAGPYSLRSAVLSMRPILYNETTYTCDKSCPNGGSCEMASDKASYVCSCPPMYTGWRCEFHLSTIKVTRRRAIATTQALVPGITTWDDTSYTYYKTFTTKDSYIIEILIGIAVFMLMLFAFCYIRVWKMRRTKETHGQNTDTNTSTNGSKENQKTQLLKKRSTSLKDDENNDNETPSLLSRKRTRSRDSIKLNEKPPLFQKKSTFSLELDTDVDQPLLHKKSTRSIIFGKDHEKPPLFHRNRTHCGDLSTDNDDTPLYCKKSTRFEDSIEDSEITLLRKKSTHFYESVADHK